MNDTRNERAWLEFHIITDVKRLRELQPTHPIVQAVEAVLTSKQQPLQLELPLDGGPLMLRRQAE